LLKKIRNGVSKDVLYSGGLVLKMCREINTLPIRNALAELMFDNSIKKNTDK
jgi:hypothetical protein